MEELRIPTHEVRVLVFTDRASVSGCLYVTETPNPVDPAGQVLTVLNDERVFVPFRADDEHGREACDVAINKEHIVRVRVVATAENETCDDGTGTPPASGESLEVELSDGSTLLGKLAVATPETASRLVDKLNQTEHFIPIISDAAVDFVHRRHVLSIK